MEERFETFTALIVNINRSIRKIKATGMAEFSLNGLHVLCLYHLSREKVLTAKDLCALCGEDKGNISRAVEYLEREGYLFCSATSRKRYRSPLMLTLKGNEAGRYIEGEVNRLLHEASKGLSENQRTVMYDSLELINKNLQEICKEYI